MIRASSFPLALACPASQDAGENILIDSYDPTATAGQDAHRAISLTLQGHDVPELPADVESLVELAVAWVNNWLKPTFPGVKWECEVFLKLGLMAGTIDLLGIDSARGLAIIVDWKNTFRDDDHTPQLLAYCWLALKERTELKGCIYIVPKLRLGVADKPVEVSRQWVEKWMEEMDRNVLSHPEVYRAGEHCLRCRRRAQCPALRERNKETVDVLAAPDFEGSLSRGIIPTLRVRVKLLQDAIDTYKRFEKQTLIDAGPIELANGKVLDVTERPRHTVDVKKAFPLLQTMFTDEEMNGFLEIGKTRLLEAVSTKAAKGMKTKYKNKVWDDLVTLGAVDTATETIVTERKKDE